MKLETKHIVGIVIVLTAIVTGVLWWVKAAYFESGAFLVTESVNVDHARRLNVKGGDLREYEFTPAKAPHYLCVFVSGTNKASLHCVPKMTPEQEAIWNRTEDSER